MLFRILVPPMHIVSIVRPLAELMSILSLTFFDLSMILQQHTFHSQFSNFGMKAWPIVTGHKCMVCQIHSFDNKLVWHINCFKAWKIRTKILVVCI